MASTTTTPLMNLVLPTVGVQVGPTWASDLNTALNLVDSHNHTSGQGSRIPSAGLNINADLSFGSNNATSLNSARFTSLAGVLSGASDKNAVYVVSGDLYYNNNSGTSIKITSGSGLNFSSLGTIGGDFGQPGVTAAVTYSDTTKVFSFTQSSGVTAKMAFGDVAIYENAASTNPVTLKSPTSLGSAVTLTLPSSIPGSQKLMSMSSAGVMEGNVAADASTVEISSNTLRIKDLGVTTAKLADGAVTAAKKASLNYSLSSSCGSFSSSSTGYVDVTNLSVSFTTNGRPVRIVLVPDGSGNIGHITGVLGSNSMTAYLAIFRDATVLSQHTIAISTTSGGTVGMYVPLSSVQTFDAPAAGTYTYKVQGKISTGTSFGVTFAKLLVYEL